MNITAHFPHTRQSWAQLKAAVADCWDLWKLARYLERRCAKRTGERLIRRKSDGTYWAAGCPQNFAYAMTGLFVRGPCDSFHFYRVREWRGLWVASRRVFWLPKSGDFTLISDGTLFVLPPWPEGIECAKIDAALAIEARKGGDGETRLHRNDESAGPKDNAQGDFA